MRGAAVIIVLAVVVLIAFRLWLGSAHDRDQSSRTVRILWRCIDILLVIAGVVGAVGLIIFLVAVIGNMVQNVS